MLSDVAVSMEMGGLEARNETQFVDLAQLKPEIP